MLHPVAHCNASMAGPLGSIFIIWAQFCEGLRLLALANSSNDISVEGRGGIGVKSKEGDEASAEAALVAFLQLHFTRDASCGQARTD